MRLLLKYCTGGRARGLAFRRAARPRRSWSSYRGKALSDRDEADSWGDFHWDGIELFPCALTEVELRTLEKECSAALRRRRYESGHWDGVIHSFREMTKPEWSSESTEVMNRLTSTSSLIPDDVDLLPPHILDLSADGFIQPHVDSLIASGDVVAGISLFSTRTLRLTPSDDARDDDDDESGASLVLRPGSFYVLTGPARYEYAHEILPGSDRRVSIIIRDTLECSTRGLDQ